MHSKFDKPNSVYQILYACFGISQAAFTFAVYVQNQLPSFQSSNDDRQWSCYGRHGIPRLSKLASRFYHEHILFPNVIL